MLLLLLFVDGAITRVRRATRSEIEDVCVSRRAMRTEGIRRAERYGESVDANSDATTEGYRTSIAIVLLLVAS